MKILEAQSATLTNYEVYTHLLNQRTRYETRSPKRRGPGNLETIVKEMLEYLRSPPSPLGNKPFPYDTNTIRTLLERLRPYDLTKAEILMIMNIRPTSIMGLTYIIEEFEARFPEAEVHEDMLAIVAEVLGQPDEAERQNMEDARERAAEARAKGSSMMDVDEQS